MPRLTSPYIYERNVFWLALAEPGHPVITFSAVAPRRRGGKPKTMAKTQRTITDIVREIMGSFPEVEEFVSHGSPTFRVRGKIFATYTINHHGDGRVALNLVAPAGAQAAFVKMQPKIYFVPPYVGPRGWLGVQLDKGLGWGTIREHVRDAYEKAAPAELERKSV